MDIDRAKLQGMGFSKEQIEQLDKEIGLEVVENELENDNIEISKNSDDAIYPAEVRIEKGQFSISHTQKLLRVRKELLLSPDFQRKDVWNRKQQSELVESVLMGIPIPIIYLFEDKKGNKQVVDGKQRITTLVKFLEGSFKLVDLKILKHLNDKGFEEIGPKLQGMFEDYQLFYYIIQPPTPERIKYDIFDRVNRGGTSLNKQEMRNALYGGKCIDLLNEICESNEFLLATGRSLRSKRMKDQYAALRVLSLLMLRTKALGQDESLKYKGDIDAFLANFMCFVNEKAEDRFISEYKTKLLEALSKCYNVLGDNAFRFNGGTVRRPISMPLMEALVYYFYLSKDDRDIEEIRMQIACLKNQFDDSSYFAGNIDSTTSMDYRFGEVEKLLTNEENDTESLY